MGRTNYIILAIGLAGCLVLALAMEHALGVQQERRTPRIVSELAAIFGPRLAAPSEFRFEQDGAGRTGLLTIHPLTAAAEAELVGQVGAHAWRTLGVEAGMARLLVTAVSSAGTARYEVMRPLMSRQPVRRLPDPPAGSPGR